MTASDDSSDISSGISTPSGEETNANNQRLVSELESLKKDYLYLRADFDNYKKSAIKERYDLMRYGSEPLIIQLLSLLDTFDQALSLEITPENIKGFQDGIKMIRTEFNNVLSRFGVVGIECAGLPFDPNLHEALGSEPTDKFPPGHICQVLKPAYKMHDRVIRPAQVVIAKAPPSGDDPVQE